MEPIVHDLDRDRQEEYILIGKRKVDISFIPAGISIPITRKYQACVDKFKEYNVIKSNGEINENAETELSIDKAEDTYNMMIDVIVTYTEFIDKEMDKKWLERNADFNMIAEAFSILTQAILKDVKRRGKKDNSKKKLNGNE